MLCCLWDGALVLDLPVLCPPFSHAELAQGVWRVLASQHHLPAAIPLLPHPGLSLEQLQVVRAGNPLSLSLLLGATTLPWPGCTRRSRVSTASDG